MGMLAEVAPPRVAVGIDPSRAALQITALSPGGERRRERRVPLAPAAVGHLEAVLDGEPAVIAMEGAHSTGQLFLLELLARQHDVREVHPVASKRFREALTEDHTDAKDATGLALLARWKGDLPAVRFSEAQASWKRVARLRGRLVRDRTRYANRLHACLSETYGAAYKGLFPKLLARRPCGSSPPIRRSTTPWTRAPSRESSWATRPGRASSGPAAGGRGPTCAACERRCGRSPPRCWR